MIRKILRKSLIANIDARYIIPRRQHPVSKTEISANALTVIHRLNRAGFQAFLVGGSVRDLLLRHSPKDFDVATNATPSQVKKLFRNARVIGRRFKIIHIAYHREIIEVATFRKQEDNSTSTQQKTNAQGMLVRDNVFGTLEDDVFRRDFTINALYYDVQTKSLIDYCGGMADIQARLIRMIGDPATRYSEDPVRMLRAIRFSAKLKFNIETHTSRCIHQLKHLIQPISHARLFDEVVKLYHCGAAETAHRLLVEYGLFQILFPQTAQFLTHDSARALITFTLESTDTRLRAEKPVTPAFFFAALLWFPLQQTYTSDDPSDSDRAFEQAIATVLTKQYQMTMIPKRHAQIIREIWTLQTQFKTRTFEHASLLCTHARFRAAYDFLALRALAQDEDVALAEWWTAFQDADPQTQYTMSQPFEDPKIS